MANESGRLLLILASRDPQTAVQLARLAHEDPAETLRRLHQLVTWGFIVADTAEDFALYRLIPRRDTALVPTAAPRILVIEDDLVVRELVVTILEDENYAVLASEAPAAAQPLLEHVQFDLVITDGFNPNSAAMLVDSMETIRAAGATPVALFSVQQVQLDAARAAGFRDILAKPFDLETFLTHVRELLRVLERPEVPLHTNGSENDIRCQVTRRKLSAGTRSDLGRDCRDAFLGLAKTCAKHAIAFWDYLGSRLGVAGAALIPPLPDLVRCPGQPT